jgi:hypothetical protein
MDGMRVALVAVALTLLLSGCATSSWYRPDVPPEIVQRDSEECRAQAQRRATRELSDDDPFFSGAASRHHRIGTPEPMTSGLAVERDVHDRCMRGKGYTLVKGPEPHRASGSP